MRGVIIVRGPDQEDDSALPHAQALQPEFTVVFAIVFHRDHWVVENGLQLSKINLVFSKEWVGVSRTANYLPATANTALGLALAMARSVRAAPLGCLRPCSQPCKVRTDTPMSAANWD